MTTKRTHTSRLTRALLETADDMRRAGVMDAAAHAKITMRHLGDKADGIAEPITGDEIRTLREEAHLTDVIDPLGGSFYVESLTDAMEEKIVAITKTVDDAGGMYKAVEAGLVQRTIGASAMRFQQRVESGEQVVVGVNKYRADHETEHRPPVERPRPHEITGPPRRRQHVALLVAAFEAHQQPIVFTRNGEHSLAVAEPHRALLLARDHGTWLLAGDAALAFAEHLVHRGRHRRVGALRRVGADAPDRPRGRLGRAPREVPASPAGHTAPTRVIAYRRCRTRRTSRSTWSPIRSTASTSPPTSSPTRGGRRM